MPRWFTHLTRNVFNPRELRAGKRPVLTHIGRVSGTTHRTPLDAHPVPDGWLFVPVYGLSSDWVRNVLAAGSAELTVDGRQIPLAEPRVVDLAEARRLVTDDVKLPPSILRIREFLVMDEAG